MDKSGMGRQSQSSSDYQDLEVNRAKVGERPVFSRVLRSVHLYTALIVGIMFAFSGLTGSILVFYKTIDEFMNPALLITEVEGEIEYVSLDKITAAAQKTVPGKVKPTRLIFPRHSQATAMVHFAIPEADGSIMKIRVSVNPFTAEVLGQREWGDYLMSFLYKLHYTLFLGKAGETAIGILGLALLFSLFSGIYLWWPKRSRLIQALKLKRSTNSLRFIYDLHKTAGIYISIVLVVIVFSGVYMIFPQYVKPVVGWVSPLTDFAPPKLSADTEPGTKELSVDEVVAIAGDLFPQAELQRVYFPASMTGIFRVIMRQPGDVRETSGSTQVWISSYDGKVLAIKNPENMSGGDTFINWMFPLHNGEAFGIVGRIIVFIAGLLLLGLYMTGLMIWWRKRKLNQCC